MSTAEPDPTFDPDAALQALTDTWGTRGTILKLLASVPPAQRLALLDVVRRDLTDGDDRGGEFWCHRCRTVRPISDLADLEPAGMTCTACADRTRR